MLCKNINMYLRTYKGKRNIYFHKYLLGYATFLLIHPFPAHSHTTHIVAGTPKTIIYQMHSCSIDVFFLLVFSKTRSDKNKNTF